MRRRGGDEEGSVREGWVGLGIVDRGQNIEVFSRVRRRVVGRENGWDG